MIQIYKDAKHYPVDIEQRIIDEERNRRKKRVKQFQKLSVDCEFVQPKSIFLRIFILNTVAASIPETFYKRVIYSAASIVEISLAIALYYLGLQTYMYSGKNITETVKKNIIGRTDFYFTLEELKKVRGKTTGEEFKKYLELFGKDIANISEEENQLGLFLDEGIPFIICIEEFLDYMIFFLEDYFRNNASEQEYSQYTDAKGYAFEQMVYEMTKNLIQESYHTLYYQPNKKQKMEIDVLFRNKENIAVLECKSGTLNMDGLGKDELIRLQIHNKTKKAFKTLRAVTEYLERTEEYNFESKNQKIVGHTDNPICIHISMYPMDFIASNVHVMFPEYLEERSPILSLSIEHLLAIMLDAKIKNKDVFGYWKKRKKDIQDYSSIYFDNNELDLYYEVVNEDNNTMLAELKRRGIIDQLNPNAEVISSFHNEYGKEVRPAKEMLRTLDMYLMKNILERGKSWFGINKRYLKNMKEYLKIK
ncbi:hypothetical protein AALC16_15500 [Lachnospiraceae bacterium 29-91]